MKKEIDEIHELREFGVSLEESKVYLAERSFYLNTKFGPLTIVKKGQRVRLSDRLGKELFFANRVVPLYLGSIFEVIRPYRIEQGGEWVDLEVGDVVKLEKEEAFPLLRELKIKERRSNDEVKSD